MTKRWNHRKKYKCISMPLFKHTNCCGRMRRRLLESNQINLGLSVGKKKSCGCSSTDSVSDCLHSAGDVLLVCWVLRAFAIQKPPLYYRSSGSLLRTVTGSCAFQNISLKEASGKVFCQNPALWTGLVPAKFCSAVAQVKSGFSLAPTFGHE